MILFFCFRDIQVSHYANLVTDDVIGCARAVVWHKIKNISVNNEAMLLKLGRDVAPYKIYQMVHISMLLKKFVRNSSTNIWSVGNAQTESLETCLLYHSPILSQFLDFTHWMLLVACYSDVPEFVLEICLVHDHVQKHDEASEDAFIKLKSL